MNFIAHIHLSGDSPTILVGNYIADLIRPKELSTLSEEVMNGVLVHRFIDTYTDAHQINRDVLDSLYPHHRKYAPVLLDIYYDYFLIRHWSQFSTIPFSEVCERTYGVLADHLDEIPVRVQTKIENLLNKRWLETAYGSIEGLERTFSFLKLRMSRPELIHGACQTLIDLDSELEEAFLKFYPQLMAAVEAKFHK